MGIKQTPLLDQLFSAILSLRSVHECYLFFEDVCTVKEITEMSQRLAVARHLHGGKKNGDVSRETGVSSATISRVNRCLQYGSGGYRLALDREGNNQVTESEPGK